MSAPVEQVRQSRLSELRLMAVHAHPDDESSKGAATMARYADEGVRVMVVTLTGGERGEILGVEHHWLGFVDSGLPEGDPPPPLPDGCLGVVPMEEPVEELVRVIRKFKPHVMTTYDENGGFPPTEPNLTRQASEAGGGGGSEPP